MYRRRVRFRLPAPGRRLRVIGFDDAPFDRAAPGPVHLAGVVCSGTRFEGMVWGQVERDGFDATAVIADLVASSKYHAQVRLILLDGISVAGLNLIDLAGLARELERPCVAVMRKMPDLEAFRRVIESLPEPRRRLAILERAGPIHQLPPFTFQVAGLSPERAHRALELVTDTGAVPEALRIAHLVGSAVMDGESRGRA